MTISVKKFLNEFILDVSLNIMIMNMTTIEKKRQWYSFKMRKQDTHRRLNTKSCHKSNIFFFQDNVFFFSFSGQFTSYFHEGIANSFNDIDLYNSLPIELKPLKHRYFSFDL